MRSKREPDDGPDAADRAASPSFYELAIRTSIGRGLRRYYDLSEPVPDHMRKLLDQLDEKSQPATARQPDTAKET
jgi:hypothetical protein